METAYIGIGSNLGDSRHVILEAWNELGAVQGIRTGSLSHPYKTEPVGMKSDNWFINAAGKINTELSPVELLACLHQIEKNFGRRRTPDAEGYHDRTLDFDLLLYGQIILDDDGVKVPHPSMQDRLFVLLPLCEIASDTLHPILNKNMGELLSILEGSGENPVVEKTIWPG